MIQQPQRLLSKNENTYLIIKIKFFYLGIGTFVRISKFLKEKK